MPPPPKSLRERQKQFARVQLLEAAERRFNEKGFAETSIEEILEAAGVSRATLYAYFTGKEGLLFAIAEQTFDDAQRQYEGFATLPEWTLPSIEKWLRDTASERIEFGPRYKSVLVSGRGFLSSPAGLDRTDGLIKAVLTRSTGWAHLDSDEAHVRARMLVVLVEQQFYDLILRDDPLDALDQFVRFTARAVILLLS